MKPRQRGEPPFRIWNEYENEGQGKRRKRIFYLDLVKISLKKNLSRKNFWEKKNKFQTQWSIHFHRSSVSLFRFLILSGEWIIERIDIGEPSTTGSLKRRYLKYYAIFKRKMEYLFYLFGKIIIRTVKSLTRRTFE